MQVVVREPLGPGMGNQTMMKINAGTPRIDLSCTEYAEPSKYAICIAFKYINKCAKYADCANQSAKKSVEKCVKKYVKYATTFSGMQNM
jgi:hypothetical protein